MKKKKFIWVLIILIVGMGAFFGQNYLNQENNQNPISNTYAKDVDLSTAIEVTRGTIRETVSTSGYIAPENEVYLSFASTGTTGGTVEEIFIKAGDLVEQGQELVKLEDKQERLNYLKAKNEYELAKISGSSSKIDETKLTMEVAQDNYISKTLKAPFSGKVVEIFVGEGDFIEGSSNVVYLIDDSSYEVVVSVSETDCLKVEVGQQVEIELGILKNQIFTGKVSEVAEYAQAESGVVTVPITIRIDEVSPFFKPQYSASAEIIVNLSENVLLVPVTAVSESNNRSVVLKVEGDKAVPTPVKIGIGDGFYQEITEGLEEGDKIIINNYQMNSTTSDSGNRGMFGGGANPGGGMPPMGRP